MATVNFAPCSLSLSLSLSLSYPVVGEVFVHDLSHLSLLSVEDVRSEVEDDVQHGCLRGQRRATVLGVGVG